MNDKSSASYERIPDDVNLISEESNISEDVAVGSLISRCDMFTCLLLIVFVLSGVCMPLLIVLITANGGAQPTTFLVTLPVYNPFILLFISIFSFLREVWV
jgi:peptidoglycan biosynthesis protein MviN/MurJ (putative lipid II flippase)